jgi:phosphoribosylformimino-5-aminoimidazole carboxamide ribotide isomerase
MKGSRVRVVPVLDLMDGCVVRAIGGERGRYQPIESRIVAGSEPIDVARAFRDRFGLTELYVADLDAIRGERGHGREVDGLLTDGFTVVLDAGVRRLPEAGWTRAPTPAGFHLVLASETVIDWSTLPAVLSGRGGKRTLISVDLKHGRLLRPAGFALGATSPATAVAMEPAVVAQPNELDPESPLEFIRARIRDGARRLLLLDLADVGREAGTATLALARALRAEGWPGELQLGGGVRGIDDLLAMRSAGADAALVASALHDGRLTRGDLERLDAEAESGPNPPG